MNDRELLELAAKAAGYGIEWQEWITSRVAEFQTIKHKKNQGFFVNGTQWDPLTNDGDALRMAVKLRIDICHNHSADHQLWVLAERAGVEGCFAPACCVEDEFEEGGRDAATRRAIVRAAAEIGKAMQ